MPTRLELERAASQWAPWTEAGSGTPKPLLVNAGTALDLSSISSRPASSRLGRRAHGFNLLGFRLPQDSEVPDFVAAIRRNGHSYVRFFGLDPWFGHGSTVSPPGHPYGCAYDAHTVDRWWKYLAAISDAGIQFSVEFLYQASAMMPGRTAWPQSPDPASASLILRATLNEPNAIEHWKHCFDALVARVNPHYAVPRRIVDDENCLFIGTGNENNLWNRGGYFFGKGEADAATVIQPHYDQWLTKRGLPAMSVPRMRGGNANESLTYGEFLLAVHEDSYRSMREHARAAGFKGSMSAVNYIPNLFDGLLRAATLDMVDCHMYFDLDDNGSGSAHRSLIGDRFHFSNWLASGFIHGKRAASTEFAVGGPSPRGYEFPFAYALAALQDMDWIAQFARMNDTLDPVDPNVWTGWFDRHVQAGQDATKDVVSAASSRIGAFLFGRGDVAAARSELGFVIRRARTLDRNPPWHAQWPHSIIDLGLLCKIRSVHETDIDSEQRWVGAGQAPTRVFDPQSDRYLLNRSLAQWVEQLRADGLLSAENCTDVSKGIFESDSRELRINVRSNSARIVTPRSHVVIWDSDERADETPFLMIDGATPRGLVSVHEISAEQRPLADMRRALIVHLTEVRGTRSDRSGPHEFVRTGWTPWAPLRYARVPTYGISGATGIGWRKESWLPARIRGGIAAIRLALPSGTVKVFRLDVRGNRLTEVATHRSVDGSVELLLDNTSTDKLMQTIYYEMTLTPDL